MVHDNAQWTRVIDALRGASRPSRPAAYISHKTIYNALCAMLMGELRCQILEPLPRAHKSRRPGSAGIDRCGLMSRATSVDKR
jgi:hypothetical protein